MNLRDYEQELKEANPRAYGKHRLKMIGINLAALFVCGGLMVILVAFGKN